MRRLLAPAQIVRRALGSNEKVHRSFGVSHKMQSAGIGSTKMRSRHVRQRFPIERFSLAFNEILDLYEVARLNMGLGAHRTHTKD